MKLFGADAGRHVRRSTATAWVGDPWARGSYSAARPGYAHCRSVLARPVAERIFFAGDACTVDTFGAINGAWASVSRRPGASPPPFEATLVLAPLDPYRFRRTVRSGFSVVRMSRSARVPRGATSAWGAWERPRAPP